MRAGSAGARHLKKSHQHLLARSAVKFQFIAEHQQEYPVAAMCRVLEVSVSGYYAWRKREPSLHSREDAELANKIKGAFQSNRCVYGSPRIHAELHAQGIHCARKRIARLMRELNACTLNLRNHIYLAALKPDAKPREAEAHSAISRWKHIASIKMQPCIYCRSTHELGQP